MLRTSLDCGQPSPTDEEIREILRKDSRAIGTVYGTHFAIRFTHKQMVPTQVLLPHAPGETAQAELRAHNPFDSRRSTSSANLPTQGQDECSAEGDSPRVAGSLLMDREGQGNWRLVERSVLRLTQWSRQPKNNQQRRPVQFKLA